MTDERPQPPQDEQPEPCQASGQADDQARETAAPDATDAPEQMSYAQYLKLVNPDKSDEEIAAMIRKENRYTWLGRFQILVLVLIVILVLVLIFTN